MNEYFETEPGLNTVALRRLIFNLVTAVFLLATVVLAGAYAVILVNPQVPLNPYPPPTLPPTLGPPTPTNTPAIYLPTEVPATATFRPLPDATDIPTATQLPTATSRPTETPTLDQTPAVTAEQGASFGLHPGSPTWIPDERGCQFLGVGGRAFDLAGSPLVGLAVSIRGELAGLNVSIDTLTGSAGDRFGTGGYYIELSDAPVASQGTLWLQLLDASSGLTLSDKIFIDTFDDCNRNLVLVNWAQIGPQS